MRLTSSNTSVIAMGGFVLAYVALGSSAYQLPHYIFVAFPLAAIITARLIHDMLDGRYARLLKIMAPAHVVIMCLLMGALLLLIAYVFDGGPMVIALWAVGLALWLYLAFSKKVAGKLLWLPAAGIIIVNLFLTNFFQEQQYF